MVEIRRRIGNNDQISYGQKRILHPDTRKLKPTYPQLIYLQAYTDAAIIGKHLGESGIKIDQRSILQTIFNLNDIFGRAIDEPPTKKKGLLGNSVNIDRMIFLGPDNAQDVIDSAIKEAVKFAENKNNGQDSDSVYETIRGILNADEKKFPPTIEVSTREEVIGYIMKKIKGMSNSRIQVTDHNGEIGSGLALLKWIDDVFKPSSSKIGGASAHLVNLLSELGENVTFTTQHNSPELSEFFNENIPFLNFEGQKLSKKTVHETSVKGAPFKINYPIEFAAGTKIEFDGQPYTAQKTDRLVVLGSYYNSDGNTYAIKPLLNCTDQQITTVAENYDYFFSTDPNQLQKIPKAEYPEIAKRMADQFKLLHSSGKIKIFYEFSGKFKNLAFFKDVLKGNIDSFSINDEEFEQITTNLQAELGIEFISNPDKTIQIYENALILAKYLEVERLHIHGHDIDISVRKSTNENIMKQEASALAFGKLKTLQWLLGKDKQFKPNTNLLKIKGIEMMYKLSQYINGDKSVEIKSLFEKGFQKIDDEYSVAILPVKWIYKGGDKIVQSISAGDTDAGTSVVHSYF